LHLSLLKKPSYLLNCLLLALLGACALTARAQGGPPFITDDPFTVPNRHWEVNIAGMATHNPGAASYNIPNFDINYGLGSRTQLKFEIPIAAATDSNNTTRAGLGNTLLGVKFRPYEHYKTGEPKSDDSVNFAIGTYPQVSINNPTSTVRRGIVETGPQYYLPLELIAKIGPIGLNGEYGHWFGNRHVPSRWGRGLIAGHEFNQYFELYGEIYDLEDINKIDNNPRQRQVTVDIGGRQSLDKHDFMRLLFMAGRSIHTANKNNSEPDWIAYLGVQIHLGPKEKDDKTESPSVLPK
jgi:hypothetical protein